MSDLKKGIDLTVTVTKEDFITNEGIFRSYFAYTLIVGNESFRLQAKPDDKKLLNYLLNDIFANFQS